MSAGLVSGKRVWTEAELEALPEDGFIHEVVDHELLMSPKNDFFHGEICSELLTAMRSFAQAQRLGAVLDSSTGFWMKNQNCRAPDISFVTRSRLREVGFKRSTRAFFPGAPDLAVEVLSPNNSRTQIAERLEDFFASGTRVAWIIDPDHRCVEVCHSPLDRKVVGADGMLDGENLLPGFKYPITDLFREWEW